MNRTLSGISPSASRMQTNNVIDGKLQCAIDLFLWYHQASHTQTLTHRRGKKKTKKKPNPSGLSMGVKVTAATSVR